MGSTRSQASWMEWELAMEDALAFNVNVVDPGARPP
jgi:hypothetical protein